MRFVLMVTKMLEDYTTQVDIEEHDNFEEVMMRYALFCASRASVLVIETENQKVVCQYTREGHSVFNKYLMDR